MIKIFQTLAQNPSKNFKIDVLKQQHDPLFWQVVQLALDPFVQFYIRKIPEYHSSSTGNVSLAQAVVSLETLSSRKLTGNAAIAFLSDLLSSVSESDAEIIKKIIQKDLKCGVSSGIVNAVIDSFIPQFPCMLCSGYSEKLIAKIKFPAYAQTKADGMRVAAIVKDGKCEFRSRNGKQIELLGNLEQELIALAQNEDVVFDGELLVRKNNKICQRQEGNGILNKANKATITAQEAALVEMVVWDIIPYRAFFTGKYNVAYKNRYEDLQLRIQFNTVQKITCIKTILVDSPEQARSIFLEELSNDQEGIILKDLSSIWQDKRSAKQIKFKAELDADLIVTDWIEGSGKYRGMLGSLQCQSADAKIKVNVGSGFSDNDRKIIDKSIIGKIITVKYNARIKNSNGEESLFLPVFIEERCDKEIANSSDQIA